MGALLGGLVGFTVYGAKKRKGGCCSKWGPTILVTISMFLVLADTVRHVLQDQGVWPEDHCPGYWKCGGSNQYICAAQGSVCCPTGANCTAGCHSNEHMSCLCAMGTLFTAIFTYVGFAFLAVGSMWNANLVGKLKEVRTQWKQLRGVVN